jgi:Fur family transcriptional regulator, zinc uptake regulator
MAGGSPGTSPLATAISLCRERREELTPARRSILESLAEARRPLGAYELLARLARKSGRKIGPPTIYRALQFLQDQKLIARIESQNRYVLCAHPERPHQCLFLVCDRCAKSTEIENPALDRLLEHEAVRAGFAAQRLVVELKGICAGCASDASGATP